MQFKPANQQIHKFKSAIRMIIMVFTLNLELLRASCITYLRTIMLLNTASLLDDTVDQKWIYTLQEKPGGIFLLNKIHHPLVGKPHVNGWC